MVLPAENGTMARIGFAVGQAPCAKAARGNAGATSAAAESWRRRRRLCVMIVYPQVARAIWMWPLRQ